MKVKRLVKALKECGDKRLPIVVIDKKGREFYLEWNCMDDGPDWAEFAFVVSDRNWPKLDTDMAKAILDYTAQDPYNRKVSMFGMDEQFRNYKLKVTWPNDRDYCGCGWQSVEVDNITYRVDDDANQTEMVLEVEELPPWNEEDYDQKKMDERNEEIKKKVAECTAYLEGKTDSLPQDDGTEE